MKIVQQSVEKMDSDNNQRQGMILVVVGLDKLNMKDKKDKKTRKGSAELEVAGDHMDKKQRHMEKDCVLDIDADAPVQPYCNWGYRTEHFENLCNLDKVVADKKGRNADAEPEVGYRTLEEDLDQV